ncbi:MAG: PilT/PilU family type 4a pilus ATPase [Proteobacteria bacterium]|nr:PilT/PilU family type 4a pilus ATPase [Pseudomonadota bacterium]MBU1140133.1 PilT/PilU family type 4a pilus ATPase [Pseudomonadota bacterium]MBU1234292.1 PilT/PilU family type 4a pilus ATPase [Pseudomonadota bacterium]MBU1417731.1 PilT/PilU family type 4a pilus ATPase [Pseudomonadota bacterium]MBU1454929.1 PilT/PilU family type 4a pilus ATPase [Pseudomonadota bacterium]
MKQTELDYWITAMLASYDDVSDLNITVGKTLQVESSGVLMPVHVTPPVKELTPFQAEVFALNLIGNNKRLLRDLIENGSCDLSYSLGDKVRFRVNIFTQKGYFTTVLRKLETTIPTIKGMNFPKAFNKMASELNGLVLFTGATGSGKTTSLAALLHKINMDRSVHIVTLEDPIEYVHPHAKATFNQRELGNDFSTFASGMRAALRQAPKVILVGEMRDRETMEIGLTAAETGHLVLSTLHTIDAGQTINRILGMFEQEEQPQIRNRLVDTIRWVVGQRLLPKIGGGRTAAMEILCTSLRVKDLIINGETEEKTFYKVIQQGSAMDMRTFDQHILELYESEVITEETALNYCSYKNEISRGLDTIKATRGEATSTLSGLAMEPEEDENRW